MCLYVPLTQWPLSFRHGQSSILLQELPCALQVVLPDIAKYPLEGKNHPPLRTTALVCVNVLPQYVLINQKSRQCFFVKYWVLVLNNTKTSNVQESISRIYSDLETKREKKCVCIDTVSIIKVVTLNV